MRWSATLWFLALTMSHSAVNRPRDPLFHRHRRQSREGCHMKRTVGNSVQPLVDYCCCLCARLCRESESRAPEGMDGVISEGCRRMDREGVLLHRGRETNGYCHQVQATSPLISNTVLRRRKHHHPVNTTIPSTPPSRQHHHPVNTTIPSTPPKSTRRCARQPI